ncbi:MAG: ATP-binding protein [Pseudomonadales bacterium]|nr:ATP-binding protein [Pseudomonadales bacterium]
MLKFDFGKYKGIIVSIALFLLLDASVLLLNFYISFEIAEDANDVNLAGRQRMLSQRMVKSLFDLDSALGTSADENRALTELQLTHDLFDTTLNAFIAGGSTMNAAKQEVMLSAVSSENGVQALKEAQLIWEPLHQKLQRVFKSFANGVTDADLRVLLDDALNYSQANNLVLLRLMNDLTNELESVAASKATRLRMIQTVGISLAVLNFFIIMFHFLRQLRDSDRKIEAARQETVDILKTVNEGLFLVKSDLNIGSQYSERLLTILNRRDLRNESLESLLSNIVTEKDLKTALSFVGLLFNGKVKEKLIGDLNPLQEVEVNIANRDGGFETKYLSFDFARVTRRGTGESGTGAQEVLVTVTDVTARVRLERELEETKAHNEQQLEMLTSILHTDANLLGAFISQSFNRFQAINDNLRQPVKNNFSYRQKNDAIFREVHAFKGDASALGLNRFEELAHQFENELERLNGTHGLKGSDYLTLAVQLDRLMNDMEMIQQLITKLASFNSVTSIAPNLSPVVSGNKIPWVNLDDLVDKVSSRQAKKVMLVTSGLQEVAVSDDVRSVLNDVVVQLVRNAVCHGLEEPKQRLYNNKHPKGRIDVRLARLPNGSLELAVQDDGRGLDAETIRAKALSMGRWSREELESWDNKKLLSVMFQPGFSTAVSVSEDAGRGVGMDVVMQRINSLQGKISISHKPGHYCRFVVQIPEPESRCQAA